MEKQKKEGGITFKSIAKGFRCNQTGAFVGRGSTKHYREILVNAMENALHLNRLPIHGQNSGYSANMTRRNFKDIFPKAQFG